MQKPLKKRAASTVTQARILEAAAQLFARQGYKGTSTRDIARLAKVNEVTLFRYFPRKWDLFSAATVSRLSRIRMGRELQSQLASDADVEVVVPRLTEFLLENFFDHPDLMRLLYVAGFEVPGAEHYVREYLGPFFDAIHGYFERCAARGEIRNIEPSIATLSLAGIVSTHRNLYRLFTGKNFRLKAEKTAPFYAEFLLTALGRPEGMAAQRVES